jgi:hypothetical protein
MTATTITDAFGNDGLALHKPGYRYPSAAQHSLDHARNVSHQVAMDELYRQHDAEEGERWRQPQNLTPNAGRSTPPPQPDPGNVHGVGSHEFTGQRVPVGNRDAVEEAYRQRDREDENAWRGGGY